MPITSQFHDEKLLPEFIKFIQENKITINNISYSDNSNNDDENNNFFNNKVRLLFNEKSLLSKFSEQGWVYDGINITYFEVKKIVIEIEEELASGNIKASRFFRSVLENSINKNLQNTNVSALSQEINKINLLDNDQEADFLKAAQEGNLTVCESYILNKNIEKITKIIDQKFGANALHWAAYNGHLEIVKLLIKHYPEMVNTLTNSGSTALANAVVKKHEKIITILLLSKANPKIYHTNKKNCFILADETKDKNIQLIFGAYLALLSDQLINAIKHCDLEEVKECIAKGAMIEEKTLGIGYPIHLAAFLGNVEIVEALIQAGASIEKTNSDADTPLHIAVRESNAAVVELLLIHRPLYKPYSSLKNNLDETPVDIAKKQCNTEILSLFKNGNKPISISSVKGTKFSAPSRLSENNNSEMMRSPNEKQPVEFRK
jgi:ankyrin repeat protein